MNLMADDKVLVRGSFDGQPEHFMKTINPRKFKTPFGKAHRILIQGILFAKVVANLILAWRKLGKSTLIFSGLIPYLILVKKARCIYIGSETHPSARKFLTQVKNTLKSSRVARLYGDVEGTTWTRNEIEVACPQLGIACWVLSGGRESQVAGLNVDVMINGEWESIRPQWFFGDDYDNPRKPTSPATVKKQIDHYHNHIRWFMDSTVASRIFFVGTIYAPSSFLTEFENTVLSANIYKIPVVNIGDNWEKLRDKYGIGYWESLWEENPEFSTAAQKKQYANAAKDGALESYFRQMILQHSADEKKKFNIKKLKNIDYTDIDMRKLNLYLLMDAGYTQNSWSDPTAIVLLGVGKGYKFYLIDVVQEQMGEEDVIAAISEMYTNYRLWEYMFQGLYIESTMFPWVQSMFHREFIKVGINIPISELKSGNKSKVFRVRAFLHPVNRGDVYIAAAAKPISDQMQIFHGEGSQKGIHALDALSYVLFPDIGGEPALPPTREEEEEFKKEQSDHAWRMILGSSAYDYGTHGKIRVPEMEGIVQDDFRLIPADVYDDWEQRYVRVEPHVAQEQGCYVYQR